MADCFGCRHLKFFETDNHLFGWWNCALRKPNDAMVGQMGGPNLVCEPPKQVCNGEYDDRYKC